jgi:ribose transport system permease protein
MTQSRLQRAATRLLSDYGMVFVLVLLCAYYSWVTYAEQHPNGGEGGRQLAREVVKRFGAGAQVLIVARDTPEDVAFADALQQHLVQGNVQVAGVVKGQPTDARQALQRMIDGDRKLDLIACNHTTAAWAVFDDLGNRFPRLAATRVVVPPSYWWPNFLRPRT